MRNAEVAEAGGGPLQRRVVLKVPADTVDRCGARGVGLLSQRRHRRSWPHPRFSLGRHIDSRPTSGSIAYYRCRSLGVPLSIVLVSLRLNPLEHLERILVGRRSGSFRTDSHGRDGVSWCKTQTRQPGTNLSVASDSRIGERIISKPLGAISFADVGPGRPRRSSGVQLVSISTG